MVLSFTCSSHLFFLLQGRVGHLAVPDVLTVPCCVAIMWADFKQALERRVISLLQLLGCISDYKFRRSNFLTPLISGVLTVLESDLNVLIPDGIGDYDDGADDELVVVTVSSSSSSSPSSAPSSFSSSLPSNKRLHPDEA